MSDNIIDFHQTVDWGLTSGQPVAPLLEFHKAYDILGWGFL